MRFFLSLLFLASCSTFKGPKIVESDFGEVIATNQGYVLVVNLDTNGKVKRGHRCFLRLKKEEEREISIPLEEGSHAYGLPVKYRGTRISQLNCGLFYFYKFKAPLVLKPFADKIVYLGDIDFELQDEGKLEWGRKKHGKQVFSAQMEDIGLTPSETLLAPLPL